MAEKKEGKLIFTPYITTKNGKRLYASAYGKTCWAIWVKNPKQRGFKF